MTMVLIGVGSNIDPENNLRLALVELAYITKVTNISTCYRTKPLKARRQNDYLNAVWKIETEETPVLLNRKLKAIEHRLGRIRTDDSYASRPIDLDIIVFGSLIYDVKGLIIPDPDIYSRPFLAIPACELAPHHVLPDSGKTIQSVADSMDALSITPEHAITETLRRIIE